MSKMVDSATMLLLVALLSAVFLNTQIPFGSAQPLSLVRTFPTPGDNIQGLAFGGGTLFAVYRESSTSSKIFKLNPNDGSIISSFNDPSLATGLAYDGTKLWTSGNYGTLTTFINRLNPADGSLELKMPSPVTGGAGGLAFLDESLWVAGAYGSFFVEILEVRPTDGAVLSHFDVDALGIFPSRELDADGTNLLYGTCVETAGAWIFTLYTLTTSGTVICSDVPFPEERAIAGLASDGINVYVADNLTGTVYVFARIPPMIQATIDIDPDTLNLKSNGEWITTYIELPEGYDVSNIDVNSILLNRTIPVDVKAPTTIGDYDLDKVPDLMVRFDRTSIIQWLGTIDYSGYTGKYCEINLAITGTVAGKQFTGIDKMKVLIG